MNFIFKTFITTAIVFIFLLTNAQEGNNKPWFDKTVQLKEIQYEKALIKIDGQTTTYDELLNIKDTSMLKVEIYHKKEAAKLFGKEARNGAVFVTTKTYVPINFPVITTADSFKYYIDDKDTIFLKAATKPGIEGDTTKRGWQRFLERNLNPIIAVDNFAPSGLYIVTARFFVNADGSITGLKIDQDPGYGTGDEVLRLMTISPAWQPASFNGKAVKSLVIQKVSFVVSGF